MWCLAEDLYIIITNNDDDDHDDDDDESTYHLYNTEQRE